MTKNVPVAIIGMGCFFPKSSGIKQYWRLLFKGEDAVSEVPSTHWSAEDYFDENPNTPDHVYCKRGGFLSHVPFDPTEFGIPPSAMEATDTSQLLGLMAAKAALENAGYNGDKPFDRSKVSVILGATGTQELVIPLGARLGYPLWRKALHACGISGPKAEEVVQKISESYVPWQENSFPGLLGNVIAGRICNRLNLGGTNCAVDAACASSMSAIHLALMELVSKNSDLVVTGGVDTLNDIFMHMCFAKTHILSPSGDARPFSKNADGTVLGEGVGILLLKRLEDAQRDGDRVYAVIKGIGTSSDGKSQSIYAPRPEGQVQALRTTYENAGIDPSTIEMLEAHGTGTRVGDRVEFQALSTVFEKVPQNNCALGSVKSNIGHTKAAAGAAGMIKAALALHHKVLPPTLKADIPDPDLNIYQSPFYLNTRSRPWIKPAGHPRRAGVSAFGFGGSNFHVVLEEYSHQKSEPSWYGIADIFALSASSREDLDLQLKALIQFAQTDPVTADIARKASESRKHFSHKDSCRLLFKIDPQHCLTEQLARVQQELAQNPATHFQQNRYSYLGGPHQPGKLAFVFPGQGSQYVNMGQTLVCMFPEALETLEKAESRFAKSGDVHSLNHYIYPKGFETGSQLKNHHDDDLQQTRIAQPAIGVISMCLFNILKRFHVVPEVLCGHSFGELTALWAAGRMSDEDYLSLAIHRGALMAKASKNGSGAMTAVRAPLEKLENILKQNNIEVFLANKNSPEQGVLSGIENHLEKAESLCREHGFVFKRLPVSAAFHTPMMKEARNSFYEFLSQADFRNSRIPVFANLTGQAYPDNREDAIRLLADQIVSPVDFVNEIQNMVASGVSTFLEVGPKKVLTDLIRNILKDRPDCHAIALDASCGNGDGCDDLAHTLCCLAALGHPVRLDLWEPPQESQYRPQKMSIAISGANIRVKTKKAPAGSQQNDSEVAKDRKEHFKPTEKNPDPEIKSSVKRNMVPDQGHRYQQDMMKDPNRIAPDQIQNALKVVQDGMKSMQALQMQTAEAHKKFLDTQTEAGRMLQQMMAHTQSLAQTVMGIHDSRTDAGFAINNSDNLDAGPFVNQNHFSQPQNSFTRKNEKASVSQKPVVSNRDDIGPQNTRTTTGSFNHHEEDHSVAIKQKPVEIPETGDLEKALLSVVSELTGYPSEMLGLDMDIESDLGIDSIKRVEILSALEEKMPNLPPVSPEQMGRLKTLKQVLEHLSSDFGTIMLENDHDQKADAENPGRKNTSHTEHSLTEHELLNIVAELTGYPVEMLGMDMDIESDLGIDSIKRVEILSALEERLPDLPRVSPEVMGRMKTLGEISASLKSASPELSSVLKDHDTHQPGSDISGEPVADTPEGLENSLLDVVSELTGYPVEMLALDMDIESDLGIDSIKRVEILSALESKMPDIPSVTPDEMGRLKTLGQILNYLRKEPGETLDNQDHAITSQGEASPAAPDKTTEAVSSNDFPIDRKMLFLEDAPAAESGEFMTFPSGRKLLVAGFDHDLARMVAQKFSDCHVDSQPIAMDAYKSRDSVPKASGLVILGNPDVGSEFLLDVLMLTRLLSGDLQDSAAEGCALLAGVSFLDGGFGFNRKNSLKPEQGGLAGLVKTAAKEWPRVTCRVVDIDPDIHDNAQISEQMVSELLDKHAENCIEIGLSPNKRVKPILVPAPSYNGPLRIRSGDVVVATGGARGVTAQAVLSLAQEVAATFILIGRSPIPESEPEWLKNLKDDHDAKQAIIRHLSAEKAPTPARVEQVLKRHRAAEEIRKTLKMISKKGAVVRYVSADVCDEHAVLDIMENIRSEFGPVRAIIHGAGVLEDRLIMDKSADQFTRVYDTKIKGLKNLLAAVRDPLSCLVLFSSVAARFGNAGQVDYAMANEVLNKMAHAEALSRPECRVVSINWGPWDGGMVTDSLKKAFIGRNIPLIPMEKGGQCMVTEMRAEPGAPVEVVIGAPISDSFSDQAQPGDTRKDISLQPVFTDPAVPNECPLSLTFKRELDLDKCPVLGDHILGGKPVVPFALMTEWLGCGALHENPGLVLQGLDNLHVVNGIKLEENKKTIRLMAGKARKKGAIFEVDVEIRDGFKNGVEVIHSRARAILGNELLQAPAFDKSVYLSAEGCGKDISELYKRILFHGLKLQGIRKILSCTSEAMVAETACAPSPEQWMKDPVRSRWIADPLVLDSAFQMAIIWCFEQKGMVCLPSYSESYRQYRPRFPEELVTTVLEIQEVTRRKMRGNFTFLDCQDNVVARLTGYEALMDPKFADAF